MEKLIIGKGEATPSLESDHSRKELALRLAEGVGFEPTVALRLRLISSQVPLTTQPPFQSAVNLEFIRHFKTPCPALAIDMKVSFGQRGRTETHSARQN